MTQPEQQRDIHEACEFFEFVRLTDSIPAADSRCIDVALLDMNHCWPNVGHDSLIHAVLDAAAELRDELVASGTKIRVLSFDVRRRFLLPDAASGRFRLFIGTGGPGHLDPRLNDGISEFSQGISEDPGWEAPLFRLFDGIRRDPEASLLAVCHSFGLMCRWAGVAFPRLRAEKSSGMPLNALTDEALEHPWFGKFAAELADHRHFRVVDNRLFDLVLQRSDIAAIATEEIGSDAVTALELERDRAGMPRIFGVNHHPEIIDRQHILAVLAEKHSHGEVSETWYRERADTMTEMFVGEKERQSQLTSHYMLLGLLRHQIARLVAAHREVAVS